MAKKKQPAALVLDSGAVESEILAFACSMIRARRIDGKPDLLPAGWLEKSMIKYGSLGWVRSETAAEGFYQIHRIGAVDRYGVPKTVTLKTEATASPQFSANVIGASLSPDEVRADLSPLEVAIVKANALARPPIFAIRRYAVAIAALDVAIPANVIASMRSQIVGVPDTLVDSVEEVLYRAAQGLPVVCTSELFESMRTADISVPFKGGDYQNLRATLWSEAVKQFGGITPAQYKAERTQSAEVSAGIAGSIDNVYQMIDQFNEDAERGGVPYRFEYVGYGQKYDVGETLESGGMPGREGA